MKNTIKKKIGSLAVGSMMAAAIVAPAPAAAGTDAYIGELMLVGYNFCPRASANADGQLLAISSNSALFSLYGTTFGGDGETTFALPDLRGRAPIGQGNGPGLSSYSLGQRGGSEGFTLTTNNMPSHNHALRATNQIGNRTGPGSDFLAKSAPGDPKQYHNGPAVVSMDAGSIANTGGSQAVSKRSPYLTMRWCVVTSGIFPSRN